MEKIQLAISLFISLFAIIVFYSIQFNKADLDFSSSIHHFSNSYSEARTLFNKRVDYLQKIYPDKIQTIRFPVVNDYVTDIAVIGSNKEKYLLHISGVHGIEGFAGSAIQSAILEHMANYHKMSTTNTSLPTIVLVHVVNPYGMANNRRVNEENIDINRNFLTEENFTDVLSRDPNFAGYLDIDSIVNPQSMPSIYLIINDVYAQMLTLYGVVRFGIHKIKQALVSGNYHFPYGLGYGGTKLSISAKNLIQLVQELKIIETSKFVTLIDVHTGLGPIGIDTLDAKFGDTSTALDSLKNLENIFPTEYSETVSTSEKYTIHKKKVVVGGIKDAVETLKKGQGAMAGYELTVGTVSGDFCRNFLAPHLDPDHRLCVIQEFGTVGMVSVGKALSGENYAFHFGSDEEKRVHQQRLKNVFNVNTAAWKSSVVHRGLMVFKQALHYTTSVSI